MNVVIIIVFCALILLSLLMSILNNDVGKKIDYLSLFFSLVLLSGAYYFNERIWLILGLILAGLIVYFILYYFTLFKRYDVNDLKSREGIVVDSFFILVTLFLIDSPKVMLLLMVIYMAENRYLFYKKYKSLL